MCQGGETGVVEELVLLMMMTAAGGGKFQCAVFEPISGSFAGIGVVIACEYN